MNNIQKLMLMVITLMAISGCSSDEKSKTKVNESKSPIINYEIPNKPKDFDLHFIPDRE